MVAFIAVNFRSFSANQRPYAWRGNQRVQTWCCRTTTIDFFKAFDSTRHPTFFINLFQVFFFALLAGPNLFFIDKRACVVFQITEIAPFESVEGFRKDSFFFSIIYLRFYLLPSTALFMLTTLPSSSPSPRLLLLWRLHKKL